MLCQMALIYDRASFGSRLVYDRASLGSRFTGLFTIGFPLAQGFTRAIKDRCSAVSQRKRLHALAINTAKELQLLRVLYNECFWLFPLLLVFKRKFCYQMDILSLGDIQSLHTYTTVSQGRGVSRSARCPSRGHLYDCESRVLHLLAWHRPCHCGPLCWVLPL